MGRYRLFQAIFKGTFIPLSLAILDTRRNKDPVVQRTRGKRWVWVHLGRWEEVGSKSESTEELTLGRQSLRKLKMLVPPLVVCSKWHSWPPKSSQNVSSTSLSAFSLSRPSSIFHFFIGIPPDTALFIPIHISYPTFIPPEPAVALAYASITHLICDSRLPLSANAIIANSFAKGGGLTWAYFARLCFAMVIADGCDLDRESSWNYFLSQWKSAILFGLDRLVYLDLYPSADESTSWQTREMRQTQDSLHTIEVEEHLYLRPQSLEISVGWRQDRY